MQLKGKRSAEWLKKSKGRFKPSLWLTEMFCATLRLPNPLRMTFQIWKSWTSSPTRTRVPPQPHLAWMWNLQARENLTWWKEVPNPSQTFTSLMRREEMQLKSGSRVSPSWSFIGSWTTRTWISRLCKRMKVISLQRKLQPPSLPLLVLCWGCSNRWADKIRKQKGRGRAKARRETYRRGIEATFETWVRMGKLILLIVLNHRKNFKWLIAQLNQHSHLGRA